MKNMVNPDKELNGRIKGLMKDKHLTQTELSKRASMSQAHLNELINGKKSWTLETLNNVAGGLGMHPYELLVPDPDMVRTPRQMELYRVYKGLSEERRRIVDMLLTPSERPLPVEFKNHDKDGKKL